MTIRLAKLLVDARCILNFSKAKNHDLMLMTGALKNMYGSIPAWNKYRLFHKRASGYGIPEATFLANHFTPPTFNIVDFVQSIDGNEVSLFREEIRSFDYFPSHRLVASKNGLAIDKYLSLKMGLDQDESPVVEYAARQGNFDVRSCPLHGDTFTTLPSWRRVTPAFNLKAKLQDKLPLTDGTISAGIRMYHFDVVDKDDTP